MSEKLYPVLPGAKKNTLIDNETYLDWYNESVTDPDGFWAKHVRRIDWFKPFTKVKNTDFNGDVSIKWYEDGVTNVSYNCIDRHLKSRGDKVAIIWEGDNPYIDKKITYRELYENVCRLSNVLKKHGVKKGDRVTIYLPMIPEAAYAMLACARIGAVHSVVFAGFSPEALAGRIVDCESTFVITADEGVRGGKPVSLKENTDTAIDIAAKQYVMVNKVLVVRRTGGKVSWGPGRDLWYHQEVASVEPTCEPEPMNAEDPLFILYTSGSTGKPKGVLHTTGGYLVYASMTHQYVFDYHDGDVYWCTADVGWVTGHSYIVYGPLANGATTLMFEGVPNFPDQGRFWEVIDKHNVNIFYTAPTAIRALMGAGDDFVTRSSRSTLRLLGSVGEPINPEAWEWYYNVVGDQKSPIVDTWWQTETGGILITPLPGATDLKPGSATRPFFGIKPQLVDGEGAVVEGAVDGNLCIIDSGPARCVRSMAITSVSSRLTSRPIKASILLVTAAAAMTTAITGLPYRVDDVLNISGHRLGTAEIESALVSHHSVSEAAVVGYPHPIKGQGIYCYVTLMTGAETQDADALRKELVAHVRKEIGPIATPDKIQFSPGLPKTRSGKIMRRILRKIAEDEFGSLGDTSTLADPGVVDDLIENRQNKK
ncbi:acetate--CoA ligase [Brucella rhizosphaerae]|uniref:acetate--CoA ligase n=1 Tax=Brucella rhizosphaerae TaxID=571254 RepID=UPI003616ADFC